MLDDSEKVLLTAENLSLAHLWAGLSFVVQSSSALLITGNNGTGKTSLIRILCGLAIPDSGRVLWRQNDIAENSEEYHTEILYVGHRDGLKDDLTPLENIQFAAALHKSPPQLSPQQALARFDVPPQQLCRDLSAGQRRRAALARLLVSRAALWLLDEPFTALDDGGKEALGQAVDNHLNGGGALIMSSHQVPNWNIPVNTLHISASPILKDNASTNLKKEKTQVTVAPINSMNNKNSINFIDTINPMNFIAAKI